MSLASWFQQTAYVASVASVSSYGTATYGARRALRCRVEAVRRATRSATGEEAVTSHVLFTDQPVLLTDRVWLPGVAATEEPRFPMGITASSDKAGARTLYQVEFG